MVGWSASLSVAATLDSARARRIGLSHFDLHRHANPIRAAQKHFTRNREVKRHTHVSSDKGFTAGFIAFPLKKPVYKSFHPPTPYLPGHPMPISFILLIALVLFIVLVTGV